LLFINMCFLSGSNRGVLAWLEAYWWQHEVSLVAHTWLRLNQLELYSWHFGRK